jgi:hypothetical protein
MASAHIEISPTATRLSGELRYFLNTLQQVVDNSDRLREIFDQIASGGDWPALAAALNLSEADAQAVYNLFGSAEAELDGAFIAQLLGRLG